MHQFIKIGLFLLAFVLAFSLAGCGSSQETVQKKETEIEKTDKKESNQEAKKENDITEADQNGSASVPVNSNTEAAKNESTNTTSTTTNNQTPKPAANNPPASKVQPATNNAQPAPAPQPKPADPAPVSNPEPVHTVTISIIGPKDRGAILSPVKVNIKQGDTVSDVLLKAAGSKVDSKGSGSSFYVEGIDNIYEFDYGPLSGWLYQVNGVMGSKSAGIVGVNDGDQIVWKYKEE